MPNTTKKATSAVDTEVIVAENANKPIVPKDVDQHQTVIVYNGFQGTLIYKSPRTGEIFRWDGFGDEQEMEIGELRNVKSAKKAFFINNWFMFGKDDEWVIEYLGLKQYYKNAVRLDEFDELFTKSAVEIEKVVSNLSKGQKKSIAYRARQLVIDGEIDSRKTTTALEKSLGIELIEK